MKKIRIAIAQINTAVGDLKGNVRKIISYIKKAKMRNADIIAFPELAITGYPPEDLLLKPQFIKDNISALEAVRLVTTDITAIVGFVDRGEGIFNAAAIISNGRIIDIYHKRYLPNYGVFDEYRYFKAGKRFPIYNFGGISFGVNICEDIWYERGPALIQAMSGANLIITINASPYHMSKASFRENLVLNRVKECNATFIYINMVGGQDELVFDGGSFIAAADGDITARGKQFKEELIIADLEIKETGKRPSAESKKHLQGLLLEGESIETITIPVKLTRKHVPELMRKKSDLMSLHEEVYHALVLGTKDYVRKNGFSKVIIGISGGIDSALVAVIATDALGRENVKGLFMPSRYTSKESYEDAYAVGKNLGIEILTIPIDDIFTAYLKTLSENFKGTRTDVTEENIQARIRGNILMAFSNKFGWLVLTTGNKSEMSIGYATLYGDMAGGFAVIKDVPKTLVYKLCKWRNKKNTVIPERILWKEPSAELKPDQRDTDTLPPYPVLDPILKAYVEEDKSFDEIMKMGCEIECVQKVIQMIDYSEYKRRQSPPGIKITPRAFGKDRRFPITNRYRSW